MNSVSLCILILIGAISQAVAQPAPLLSVSHDGSHRRERLFISPMGEPFREAPNNAAAWFAQADADHDGKMTLAEFRADAMRFFALLDVDHDHEIGPEEIDRYEREIAPETSSGGGFGDFSRPSGGNREGGRSGRGGRGDAGGMGGGGMGGGMGGGGRGRAGGGDGSDGEGGSHASGPTSEPTSQGAARFSYLAIPEPVIAADADFNRGVSDREFLQAASRRFALLDTNHDGVLTPEELPQFGEANADRRHRRPKD